MRYVQNINSARLSCLVTDKAAIVSIMHKEKCFIKIQHTKRKMSVICDILHTSDYNYKRSINYTFLHTYTYKYIEIKM